MSSVVIVETPLQMLNAIEASFSLNLGDTILVIITSPPFPEEVFRPLLAFTKWNRIIFFHLIHHAPAVNLSILGKTTSERLNEYLKECRQLAKRRKLESLIKTLANVENLVIGNYLSGYMRHFANRLRPRHLYLVDDGTDTLRVAKLRTEQEVPFSMKEADLVVINMCSVRQSAVDRVYGLSPQIAALRRKNKGFKAILTGCILNPEKRKLGEIFDFVLDKKDMAGWPELIKKGKGKDKGDYLKIAPKHGSNIRFSSPSATAAIISAPIAVPYTRGRLVSRRYKDILKEVKELVNSGYKEIWLLGAKLPALQANPSKTDRPRYWMRKLSSRACAS